VSAACPVFAVFSPRFARCLRLAGMVIQHTYGPAGRLFVLELLQGPSGIEEWTFRCLLDEKTHATALLGRTPLIFQFDVSCVNFLRPHRGRLWINARLRDTVWVKVHHCRTMGAFDCTPRCVLT
jgi:hypothetical protein